MKRYDPKSLEPKWQQIWQDTRLYETSNDDPRPKWYQLEFFPYPSGVTMHVGHVRNYVISDAFARYKRMTGHNVLHPMGWDAFGLPAENQAIKTGTPPRKSTEGNIEVFKRQLNQVGLSYDWSREINSSEPDYYKWTQWLFLLLYKKGLAYKAEASVNWCPHDKTVLANEQVIKKNGVNVCERCEHEVEKRQLPQWLFKITDYADRLLADLDELDWPENVKAMQRNWIGRSVGAEIEFRLNNVAGQDDGKHAVRVFTTRADTLAGATFLVISPETAKSWIDIGWKANDEVRKYISAAEQKSEIERQDEGKEKTGVDTEMSSVNPVTGHSMPVWVADYVLGGYGTGAVMGVPAHDVRDYTFAKKYGLAIVPVIEPEQADQLADGVCYTGEGILINSGEFDGLSTSDGREKMTVRFGTEKVNYKVRDWLISRQRYWGAPIPMVYCEKDGIVPVPEDQLPVVLPDLESYLPADDGRSPLARATEWLHTTCPKCGGPAERETDTMDTFVDSSWYFLRFTDPHNDKAPFNPEIANKWMPVDTYVGGVEHAVMHLLFARFFQKVLFDEKLAAASEPFARLRNQGMIGGADGRKMGKRYGNFVTPDDLINEGYGADSLRLYELFIGPYDQGVDWNPTGIDGTKRFLNRVWALVQEHLESSERANGNTGTDQALEAAVEAATHRALKKVTADLEHFNFNTAIASMMELVNELYKLKVKVPLGSEVWHNNLKVLVQMLAPFAPHVTEELWQELGGESSVHVSHWPSFDASLIKESLSRVVVQVNGKLRGQLEVEVGTNEEEVANQAKKLDPVQKQLDGRIVVKIVFVPNKLINFVVK